MFGSFGGLSSVTIATVIAAQMSTDDLERNRAASFRSPRATIHHRLYSFFVYIKWPDKRESLGY